MKLHLERYTLQALTKDEEVDETSEELALAICEQAMFPASYILPGDYLSRERFSHVIRTLNFQASPGYPYSTESPTIGEWLGFDGLNFNDHQVDRLWCDVGFVIKGETEMWLKAFIKMEPHKLTKAVEGRWRVIMCFPLNYQVLWKMLFDYGNNAILEAAYDTPVQHGLKMVGGNWKLFYSQWQHLGLNAGTDISAFDWCVTYRKMKLVYELRRRLAKGPHVEEWFSLASRLLSELFIGPKILFPSGEVYIMTVPAVQKSGSPNTIGDNSILRLLESVVVSIRAGLPIYPLPRVVGDDALEKVNHTSEYVEILKRAYSERGWILKQVVPGMDFVGHVFVPSGPMPLYEGKHIWRLLHMPDEIVPEFLDGMARLYAHSPKFRMWKAVAECLGVKLLSQEFYKTWYNFEALTIL